MFVLHRPPESSIESVLAWLNERSWFFNVIGEAKIDRMMRVFEYAARRYQIKHFIVDSLAKCGLDEDDFNGQKRCVERLCDFKYKHDVHVHLIAHARKGHSESDRPHKHDVKGSGAITDLVENVVMVWRDKDAEQHNRDRQSHIEELDFMSTAEIAVEKQRNHQWEGIVKLYYDTVSMRYMEIAANPQPYIDKLALEEVA
jgi:twinkle protein